MPSILNFEGIRLCIYYSDNDKHKMHHVHAEHQGDTAVFSIQNGEILSGGFKSNKKQQLVQE